jgi:hypothetical protein
MGLCARVDFKGISIFCRAPNRRAVGRAKQAPATGPRWAVVPGDALRRWPTKIQIQPQRMASAASHVNPTRQMVLNTAAEP